MASRTRHCVIRCAASLVLLAIPAVGSVYPVPPAPVMYFPYLFLAYLAVGIVWILSFYRRRPSASVSIRQDLQLAHDRFTGTAAAYGPTVPTTEPTAPSFCLRCTGTDR